MDEEINGYIGYERGMLDCIKAICKFIEDDGGTYRSFIYDYLEFDDYIAAQDAGGIHLVNWINEGINNGKSNNIAPL
jgi:hypothetical protein